MDLRYFLETGIVMYCGRDGECRYGDGIEENCEALRGTPALESVDKLGCRLLLQMPVLS